MVGKAADVAPEMIVHRVGGGDSANLKLSSLDRQLVPPGLSTLLGGTPQEAAQAMRRAFPGSRKWQRIAGTVGTTTAAALRQTGFEIVPDPTDRFPNHARIIHPSGLAGFTDENLAILAQVFTNSTGC